MTNWLLGSRSKDFLKIYGRNGYILSYKEAYTVKISQLLEIPHKKLIRLLGQLLCFFFYIVWVRILKRKLPQPFTLQHEIKKICGMKYIFNVDIQASQSLLGSRCERRHAKNSKRCSRGVNSMGTRSESHYGCLQSLGHFSQKAFNTGPFFLPQVLGYQSLDCYPPKLCHSLRVL